MIQSEVVTVDLLLKSFSLPLLLYGSEAVDLSVTNIGVLDNCLNRAVYRIFGVNWFREFVAIKGTFRVI